MKKISTIVSSRSLRLFLGGLLFTMPVLLWAKGDDLPIPILKDGALSESSVLPVAAFAKRWTIQLGSGSVSVLEAQASKLRVDWPDARVVQIGGQGKLVVGSWLSPLDAGSALKSLRVVNAQAFVRQLPAESPSYSMQPVMANASNSKAIKSPNALTPKMPTTVTNETVQTTPPDMSTPEPETLPIVKDADALPAVFAVAAENKTILLPETRELQVAADLLEQSSVSSESVSRSLVQGAQTPDAWLQTEKRGIVLPMRVKEPIDSQSVPVLVEPLNLMLSPLYLLPADVNSQQPSHALTMTAVLEALVKPVLSRHTEEKTLVESHSVDPIAARKAKILFRIAELANAGLWEMALPLVKEAKLKEMKLSAVDNLLLGWVWLQNKEPRIAKGYFQTVLAQSPQDEARYALGLCYLLLGDKAATQLLLKEMRSGQQRDHLRRLLLGQ